MGKKGKVKKTIEIENEEEEDEIMEIDENGNLSDSTTVTDEDDASDKTSDNYFKGFKKNLKDVIRRNERSWDKNMKKFDENAFHKEWEEKSGVKSNNEYFDVKDLMAQNPFPKLDPIPTDYTFMFQNLAKMEADMKEPFVEDEHVNEFSDYNLKGKLKLMDSRYVIPKKENQNDSKTKIVPSPESPAISVDKENKSSQIDNRPTKANNSEIAASSNPALNSPAPLPVVAKKSAPPPPTSEVPMPRPATTAVTTQIRSPFPNLLAAAAAASAKSNSNPNPVKSQNALPTTTAMFVSHSPTKATTTINKGFSPNLSPTIALTLPRFILMERLKSIRQIGTISPYSMPPPILIRQINRPSLFPSPIQPKTSQLLIQRLNRPRFPQAPQGQGQRLQSFTPLNNNNNNQRPSLTSNQQSSSPRIVKTVGFNKTPTPSPEKTTQLLIPKTEKLKSPEKSQEEKTKIPEFPAAKSAIESKMIFKGSILICKECRMEFPSTSDHLLRKHMLISHKIELTDRQITLSVAKAKNETGSDSEVDNKVLYFRCRKCLSLFYEECPSHFKACHSDTYMLMKISQTYDKCYFNKCLKNSSGSGEREAGDEAEASVLKCRICPEDEPCSISSFETRTALRAHMKENHHSEEGKFIFDPEFRCSICLKKIDSSDKLFEHVKGHNSQPNGNRVTDESIVKELSEEFLYCAICSKKHPNFLEAQTCLKNNGFIKCILCSFMIRTKILFFQHTKAAHGSTLKENLLNCPFCEKCQIAKVRDVFEHVISEHYSKYI